MGTNDSRQRRPGTWIELNIEDCQSAQIFKMEVHVGTLTKGQDLFN